VAGLVVGLTAVLGVVGCGSAPPGGTPSPSLSARSPDRDALAGLAAAAKDRRYVATYTLTTPRRPDRTVTVAIATDGTWIVAVPGAALDGRVDVAVYRSDKGLYQCAVGPAAGPVPPGCVRVRRLDEAHDPRVQHLFVDWIDAFLDRAAALSVRAVPPLEGAGGACYSVESNSAALAPPVDPGIYCYRSDGMLTAARVGFGTLRLSGRIGDAPSSVARPAPVVKRSPLTTAAPTPPPTTATG
jgi:hypothetical protein